MYIYRKLEIMENLEFTAKTEAEVFGELVWSMMWQRKMRVKELAEKAGITKATLYKVFRGQSCRTDLLMKVLAALEVRAVLQPIK